MTAPPADSVYPARLEVDYPEQHDRMTTFLRVFTVIPIGIVLAVLTAGATQTQTVYDKSGEVVRTSSGGIGVGRWWLRVQAYAFLLVTDRYPPFALT